MSVAFFFGMVKRVVRRQKSEPDSTLNAKYDKCGDILQNYEPRSTRNELLD